MMTLNSDRGPEPTPEMTRQIEEAMLYDSVLRRPIIPARCLAAGGGKGVESK